MRANQSEYRGVGLGNEWPKSWGELLRPTLSSMAYVWFRALPVGES
jgi:hypothetical protein